VLFIVVGLLLVLISRRLSVSRRKREGYDRKHPIDAGDVAHRFDPSSSWSVAGTVCLGGSRALGALHADTRCVVLTSRMLGSVAIERRAVTGVRMIGQFNRYVHFDSDDGRYDAILFRSTIGAPVTSVLGSLGWPVAGQELPATVTASATPTDPSYALLPPPPPPPARAFGGGGSITRAIPSSSAVDRFEPLARRIVPTLLWMTLGLALVLLALSYAAPPPAPATMHAISHLLTVLTFVLVALSFLCMALRQFADQSNPASQLTLRRPFSQKGRLRRTVLGWLLLVFLLASLVAAFSGQRGNPSQQDGLYYVTRNSIPHEVDAATYRRVVAISRRPSLGADIFFCTLALLMWGAGAGMVRNEDESGLPA